MPIQRDTSRETWAAEYREQAEAELIQAACRELRAALPGDLNGSDSRVVLCDSMEAFTTSQIANLFEYNGDIEYLVVWASNIDGSEIPSYESWANADDADLRAEVAYEESKADYE